MIRPRTLTGLVVAAVVLLAAGVWMNLASQPALAVVRPGTFVFPGLTQHLQTADRVEISHGDKKAVLERTKSGTWGLAERADYPVDPAKLHKMLTGLAEMRLVAPRTAQKALWGRLGLAAPADKNNGATLIRVLDGKKVLAALLIGHHQYAVAPSAPPQMFIRRPGKVQTWLADGSVDAEANPTSWLPSSIINIPPAEIDHVRVAREDAPPLVFDRSNGKLTLSQPAKHPALNQDKVDDVASGLSELTLEDVRAAADARPPLGISRFTTKDGLEVTAVVRKGKAKTVWVSFEVDAGTSAKPATQKQAKKLEAKLSGWAYQMGDWSESSLLPTLDQLKAAPSKGTAATQ